MLKFVFWGLLICLSGCGFKPLYQNTQHPVAAALHRVKIASIENREGQILHTHLSQMFGSNRTNAPQEYLLTIKVQYDKRPLAISKSAATVEESINLKLTYKLTRIETGEEILSTQESFSLDSTVSSQSPYANWVGERNAQERLLFEAAETIRTAVTAALTESEH